LKVKELKACAKNKRATVPSCADNPSDRPNVAWNNIRYDPKYGSAGGLSKKALEQGESL
jgi:hypothetical protein